MFSYFFFFGQGWAINVETTKVAFLPFLLGTVSAARVRVIAFGTTSAAQSLPCRVVWTVMARQV